MWFLVTCQVVDYLIDPFVGGTCGGDPDSLSVSIHLHHLFIHPILLCVQISERIR